MTTFRELFEASKVTKEDLEPKILKIFNSLKSSSDLNYMRLVGGDLIDIGGKFMVDISAEWTGKSEWKYPEEKYDKDRDDYRDYLEDAIKKGLGKDAKYFKRFIVDFGKSVSISSSALWHA